MRNGAGRGADGLAACASWRRSVRRVALAVGEGSVVVVQVRALFIVGRLDLLERELTLPFGELEAIGDLRPTAERADWPTLTVSSPM
ncbi:MAG: hypothetical protein H0U12_10450 [Thermoleophilaceae bacterium]|nr:hypothetical protein [Thermoleophilaceae bacterium]